MGHLVGYARVSTQDQTDAMQLDALREAGCKKIFRETLSGAKADRPQLAAALDYLREGDTLVVWKLDRLARSTKQLIETIEDLKGRGIGFRSLTQQLDTTTPGGKFIFSVFGAMAEFERDLIIERTRTGLIAAQARGRRGARPSTVSEETKRTILHLLRTTDSPFAVIAAQFKLSKATMHRTFPGTRVSYRQ